MTGLAVCQACVLGIRIEVDAIRNTQTLTSLCGLLKTLVILARAVLSVTTLEDCKVNLICYLVPIDHIGVTGINAEQRRHVAEFRGCLHRILYESLRLFLIHERKRPCFTALFPNDRLAIGLNVNVLEWSKGDKVAVAVLCAILGEIRSANSNARRLPIIIEADFSAPLFQQVALPIRARVTVMPNLKPDDFTILEAVEVDLCA